MTVREGVDVAKCDWETSSNPPCVYRILRGPVRVFCGGKASFWVSG